MASTQSLGISTPSAVPHLVSEGLLPPEPNASHYTWRTFSLGEEGSCPTFEELLYTETCVAWSRGGSLRKLYKFGVEKESVRQAVFARFEGIESEPGPKKASDAREPGIVKSSRQNRGSDAKTSVRGKSEAGNDDEDEDNRALVVFLKTQAHIYFLTGTHYLVHLPFEVAAAFPLSTGLLLQRKLAAHDHDAPTPPLPPDPNPSVEYYQSSSFGQPQDQFGQAVASSQRIDCPPAIASMLNSVFGQKPKSDNSVPAHFFLRDPIAELGIAVERSSEPVRSKSSKQNKKLDAHENIVYISSESSLSGDRRDDPFLLAVSSNSCTGQYNVWKVSDIKASSRPSDNRRISAATSGAVTRRRSSFGPGTGATTPAVRTSMGPRESLGQFRESINDSMIQNDEDLQSQLDPAFETPGVPLLRTSRRISSLLARSELSGTRDTSNFTDLASGHARIGGIRRGPSFGGPGGRKSFGGPATQEKFRSRASSSHPDAGKTLNDARIDEILDSDGSDGGSSIPSKSLPKLETPVQNELVFTKIYSFGAATSFTGWQTSIKGSENPVNVFRIDPPKHSNPQLDGSHSVICIMDHKSRQFYFLHMLVKKSSMRSRVTDAAARFDVRVVDVKRAEGIIDACKVSDGPISRVLVFSGSDSEGGQLSLQSPWGMQSLLRIPKQFLVHEPYRIDNVQGDRKKREGGFKRVLSEGPDDIQALRQCLAQGQFELCDSAWVKHRLQVRMSPQNPLVFQAFHICEFVLQVSDAEWEPLQRAWWDAVAWLLQRQTDDDVEWKAFLIVIFSLFVNYLSSPKNVPPPRAKRKSGLLRSSSGADMDLEAFDDMMKIESSMKGASPPWMHQNAWSWILEEQVADSPSQKTSPQGRTKRSSLSTSDIHSSSLNQKLNLIPEYVELAKEFAQSEEGVKALGERGYVPTALSVDATSRDIAMPTVLLALHLLREELKLNVLCAEPLHALTPVLAQLGGWLDWDDWGWKSSSFYMLESAEMERYKFDESTLKIQTDIRQPITPPSILEFVETIGNGVQGQSFPTLEDVATSERSSKAITYALEQLTPRTTLVLKLLKMQSNDPTAFIKFVEQTHLDLGILDTLPEGIAAHLRSSIAACQASPKNSYSPRILDIIDRNDINMLDRHESTFKPQSRVSELASHEAVRDVHAICNSTFEVEQVGAFDGSAEIDRQAVTRLIFKDDQRFAEATKLVHPLKRAIAWCRPEEEWSDTDLLEAQQEIAKIVAIRTLAVSPGRGMLFYSARFPLLTEKFPIHGFSLSSIMKPTNTIVTADKNIYTEEKVSWAFFHAGVEAGLSISKDAKGIDTSWILFNKPFELNNRHAGFLLALGLNGHLKNIAKWVAFKYLTPKHTMTSIGLLLGLSASYLGTMDTLITRLLSVHVTRMLPPGAAELNLSPLTQTTGIMAIGLLYCNTQHRRMSEIMLSEMENIDLDDANNPLELLRDEGYRLSAGFALGFINLGQGKNMSGLRDMRIVERLLALAVATKRVDIVHILDKATAAATIATALIFMKTGDEALAKKTDIPDTTHQFVYVRPDIFLLRTVARHLIMWDDITPTFAWIRKSLPPSLQDQAKLGDYKYLSSEQLPLFNIVAGLCLSIGLRFAGTARQDVRDLLVHYLDCFMRITATAGLSYDERLTRTTARNCQDVVALAVASVMAGTGDICLFRRFRILHARTDADTPYGSHLAAHQAIGVLFLGGGTYTFNTSNLAVASLLCAFYPLFPTAVLDNKSHLQAFRHFWVLASEPRCLVIRAVETRRPITMEIVIRMRSGKAFEAHAPCLLPSLDKIARIESNDPQYWPVILDFENNTSHREAFGRHQSMFVRRRGAYDSSSTIFGTTIRALNDAAMTHQTSRHIFEWIFTLPSLTTLDRAERTLVLPADGASLAHNAMRSTAVDTRLALERDSLESDKAEKLWDLRVLFAWADKVAREKGELNWLGKEVLDGLKARVALLGREAANAL